MEGFFLNHNDTTTRRHFMVTQHSRWFFVSLCRRGLFFRPLLLLIIIGGCGRGAPAPPADLRTSAASDSLATSSEPGFDWPCFLGPDHNGVSKETGVLDAWQKGTAPEWTRGARGRLREQPITRRRFLSPWSTCETTKRTSRRARAGEH